MPEDKGKVVKAPESNSNNDFAPQLLKDKSQLPKNAVFMGNDANGNPRWKAVTKHEEAKKKTYPPTTGGKKYTGPPRKKDPEKSSTFGSTEEWFTMEPTVTPKKQTNLYGEISTRRNLLSKLTANQDYDTYNFADATGNFTNNGIRANFQNGKHFELDNNGNKVFTGKTLDDFTNNSIEQIETPMMSGVNKPNTIDNVNFSQKGTNFTKNASGGGGVNNVSTATDVYIPKQYDASGVEIPSDSGLKPVGTSIETKEVGKMYPTTIKGSFAKGGIVSKIKGYSVGGNINYNEFGSVNGVVEQNDKYTAQNKKEDEKTKKARNTKYDEAIRGLGQGVMVAGDAMNEKPTDIYADPKKDAAEKAVNDSVVAGASSINPWTALMVGASNIGKSGLKKDKYGDLEGGANQAAGEAMTAAPFAYSESAKKEGLGAVARDVFLGGQYIRAVSSGLGQGEKTSGFVGGINKFSGLTKRNEIRDKPFSQQKKEAAELSIKTRQEQAILNRNNNEENAKIIDPYAVSENPQYDKDKRLILNDGSIYQGKPMNKGGVVSKIQMCSDGGKIVGKGTGKSDSILAKVEADSFIVPAKNAEVAEELREKFLGKPPKQKANLNDKNGELVKLSNGEHKFTPEEKHELLEKGVNVDALAPDSKVKAVEKKSHVMFPNVIGLKEGGNVPKGTVIDGVTWNGTNWIDANGNKYTAEKGKTFEQKYNQSVAKAKSNEDTRKASEINLYSRKLKEATDAGNTEEAGRLQAKINELSGTKISKAETPTETKTSVKVPSANRVPKSSAKVTVDNLPTKDLSLAGLKEDAELKANAAAIDADKSIANAPTRQAVINDSNKANNDAYVSSNPTQRRGGIMDKIGNIDPTSFVGIGQTALGLNMLGKSKRPIDKAVIDPTYNTAVNRAQQDALFGLTPEQRFAAEQDIQGGLNDAKMAGLNSSGVQSFNLNRAAINDAWRNKLGLKQADSEMRMNKQKYADAMAADRANILSANRRQAYNDAMNTFQQNQQAGSELIGAGLQNTIGAYRYNKTKAQQDEENAMRNPWINYKA